MVRAIEADSDQTVGIYFKYNTVTLEYETFLKVGATETKLLTAADIPPGSGVVSINGMNGVVTILGSDITVSSGDSRTIDAALTGLSASIDYTKACVAYKELTNTASQNIPAGAYVIWKNDPYIANQAISLGDTLSATNLDAISSGGITNNILDLIKPVVYEVTTDDTSYTRGSVFFYKSYRTLIVKITGFVSLPNGGFTKLCDLPSGIHVDATDTYDLIGYADGTSILNPRALRVRLNASTQALEIYNYGASLSISNGTFQAVFII